MKLIFPIVGIRHCLPEEEVCEFILSLPDAAEIVLVYDNANMHDRYAIQAWTDIQIHGEIVKKQIGYVASDYAPMIRANYPEAQLVYAQVVHPDTSIPNDTAFEVALEVENPIIPSEPQRILMEPIANLPLPIIQPERSIMLAEVMQAHYSFAQLDEEKQRDLEVIHEVINLVKKVAPYLNRSLAVDERNAYILLSTMLTYLHEQWTCLSEEIWQERDLLDDAHRKAFKSPEHCAQIMEGEMQALRQQASTFFEQYTGVLKAGLTTKEQQIHQHQQWLMALPDNLYASIKDKPTFASKLYYERFSMEELQAIYLHLLCLEWLQEKTENRLPEFAEQAIATFSFWEKQATPTQKRNFVLQLREAVRSPKEPIATVALRIKQAQKDWIIVRSPRPFAQFVKELNRFLEQPIKENSLRKRYYPKSHDAYDND